MKDHDYWSIYYNITNNFECFEIICNRTEQLYSLSKTLESWNLSKYIKFTDQNSLTNVRRFWDYYGSMFKQSSRDFTFSLSKVPARLYQVFHRTKHPEYDMKAYRSLDLFSMKDTKFYHICSTHLKNRQCGGEEFYGEYSRQSIVLIRALPMTAVFCRPE